MQVQDQIIEETIGTPLFENQNTNRRAWVLRSDEEFLAARYIAVHHLPLRTITQILCGGTENENSKCNLTVFPALKVHCCKFIGMERRICLLFNKE